MSPMNLTPRICLSNNLPIILEQLFPDESQRTKRLVSAGRRKMAGSNLNKIRAGKKGTALMKPTILVDTREQDTYSFNPLKVNIKRKSLKTGDYSLEGFEHLVSVERKNPDDFVKTLIPPKKRFRKELQRLTEMPYSCIVVEANLEDILLGNYQSNASPLSVFNMANSIIADWKIPIFYCSNRQIACRFTQEYLIRVWNRLTDKNLRKVA